MSQKLVVGPINQGKVTNRLPFNIDNDSFPTLINAFQWRGRVKRKRGTVLLSRLYRFFNSTSTSYNTGTTTITLTASGNGNILINSSWNLYQSSGFPPSLVPGSVTITAPGPTLYTDAAEDGTLSPSGTINYTTGNIHIAAEAGNAVSVTFLYYPSLPVMGLEDVSLDTTDFPQTMCFDTIYSYILNNTTPNTVYDVSFYCNPDVAATLPGYTAKTVWTPTSWNGQNYQQFWTTNYEGSFWATNGINIPFSLTNIGMQYKNISVVNNITAGPPAIVDITFTSSAGLSIGDFLFINEVVTTTGINYQTGYVTAINVGGNPAKVTVEFPSATIATNGTGGIAQYLTNRSDTTKDCLRYYTGDPTNGDTTSPGFSKGKGWINFAPPLCQSIFSISQQTAKIWYLVGARMIVPFKDRLLFIGPVIQSKAGTDQTYLPDTVIYSQNGTPYYTCSFTGEPTSSTTTFAPLLVPSGQTATAPSWFEDSTGFGGFISAGLQDTILTCSSNEDVLIMGFTGYQTRFVYTGNDILPFNFFVINSEYGSNSTFSTINMDKAVLTKGPRGFVMTSQVGSDRFDLPIPDQVFEISLESNGNERVCSQRDFINEWIYFTYLGNGVNYKFPSQTLMYNYRDNSFAVFNESYTTYGQFRRRTGFTWLTVGLTYPTWEDWNDPWNAGESTLLQPEIIGGNQQGFVLLRDDGTGEGNSLEISNFSFPVTITGATTANPCVLTAANSFVAGERITITGVVGMTELNGNTYLINSATSTTITINQNSTLFTPYVSGGTATPTATVYCPNHCLTPNDYIVVSGVLGTMSQQVNGKIFTVKTTNANGFELTPGISSGTYLGGGYIKRLYRPFIQTKQFPTNWGDAKKTRIGPQQYLLSRTNSAQIQLLIYLSQDSFNAWNSGPIVPDDQAINDGLIYSTVLYTCPESTNLGLLPASSNMLVPSNSNLQMLTKVSGSGSSSNSSSQIWHRLNTSLIGDTIQLGFTLSDEQMLSFDEITAGTAITGASQASQCILTTTAGFSIGQMVKLSGVIGMVQLNFNESRNNYYQVVATSATNITIDINSTAFTAYVSGGLVIPVHINNQFAEIELHGFIMDVSPSMVLA